MSKSKTKKPAAKTPKAEAKTAEEVPMTFAAPIGDKPGMYKPELIDITKLTPHPRNYKTHPPDQLAHISESIKQHGFYRNVVIARDGTILAGHGVVQAASQIGITHVPVFRLDLAFDDPRALKVLASDNELPKFAETDDRMLSDILRSISLDDPMGLLGTGFDEQALAALVMVTRPASEIADFSAAAEWVGMPEYIDGIDKLRLVVTFKNEAERLALCEKIGIKPTARGKSVWSARWPQEELRDLAMAEFGTAPPDAS